MISARLLGKTRSDLLPRAMADKLTSASRKIAIVGVLPFIEIKFCGNWEKRLLGAIL